ncbi:MAG: alpha/beta hydrolase domain-containing protein [Vicinamibacterales bacterium]
MNASAFQIRARVPSAGTHRRLPLGRVALVLAAATLLTAARVEAQITRIVFDPARSESPTFERRVFGPNGSVGQYEKLRGKAYGELDPADPRNAVITDLVRAPRNARGKVEYSMDVFMLKPVDVGKGNHRLILDFNNRGEMRIAALNDAPLSNNPKTAAQAGTGFIMNLGYSVVGIGWDFGATSENDGMTISVPVAKNSDGSSITGPSYEYINFDDAKSVRYELTYPAATLDKSKATLTVRGRLDDPPAAVPSSGWEYVDERTIRLLPAGTPFKQSHVYEFTYTAKDPVVAAVGLAATRDLMSFLRHAAKDASGTLNPLAGDVRYTFSFSISQPTRTLNDFLALGFNQDEKGGRVIDGMLKWTGGGSGDQINYRFAQTGRTERNRQNHLYPEGVFPFAYPVLTDHLSGKTGGRSARCAASNTCPKAFDGNSSNEYWVKAGSLLHTDTRGNDLRDPDNVRFFLISGLSHGVGNVTSMGTCQQFLNPTSPFPALRALLVALDRWVTDGTEPPQSRVPRRADNTMVKATPRPGHQTGVVPQDALGWPTIPGVTYTGLITTRYHLDFGPMLDKGIVSTFPSSLTGRDAYPIFVSRVDQDGNEAAGIRLPPVEAPIATTTGWALRRTGFGEGEGCEASGQHIAFKTTKAERMAAGDPRLSLEERYMNHEGYVAAVKAAAEKLEKQRLLLPADVQQYVERARAGNVLR